MTDESKLRVIGARDAAALDIEPLFGRDARVLKRRVVEDAAEIATRIDAACDAARRIVESAREEADAIASAAYAQGRERGLEDALGLLAEAQRIRDEARRGAQEEMLELAFQLAGRIVHRSVQIDRGAMVDIVRARLQEVRGAPRITVRVSPDSLSSLEAERERLRADVDGVPLVFEADAALADADCILETERGRADARVSVQLQVLRDALSTRDSS